MYGLLLGIEFEDKYICMAKMINIVTNVLYGE